MDVFRKIDQSAQLRRELTILKRILSTGYSDEVVMDENTTKDLEERVQEIDQELREIWQ